jgi:hypothetical protein
VETFSGAGQPHCSFLVATEACGTAYADDITAA